MGSAVRECRNRIRPSASSQVLSKVLAVEHILDPPVARLLDPFLSAATSLIVRNMLAGGDARDCNRGRLAERLIQIRDEMVDTRG